LAAAERAAGFGALWRRSSRHRRDQVLAVGGVWAVGGVLAALASDPHRLRVGLQAEWSPGSARVEAPRSVSHRMRYALAGLAVGIAHMQ
jgi:hypothetical protein